MGHKKHCHSHKKHNCSKLPQPPKNTLVPLEGQNCICCNDDKKLCSKHNVNEYLDCQNYQEFCADVNTPVIGYQGYSPSNPALYYTPDPATNVPPNQKLIWPVPVPPTVDLTGKNVLVVGASKGIGQTIAELFKSKGCNVIGTSGHPDCYNVSGYTFPLLKLDIRFTEDVTKFFHHLMTSVWTNGKIDILVNCPGIHWDGDLASANGDDLSDICSFQIGGYQRVVHKALPFMKHSNLTRIISLGSIAGEFPVLGGYGITKKGLQQWNDIHMHEAMVRKARGSVAEPTFSLVEPAFILTSIGLYESYNAADTNLTNPNFRGDNFTFKLQQNVTAPNPVSVVANDIYNISMAVQPGVRYMSDNGIPVPGLNQNWAEIITGNNIISADDTINQIISPFFAAAANLPAVQAAQKQIKEAYCP